MRAGTRRWCADGPTLAKLPARAFDAQLERRQPCGVSPDANGPEDRLRLANARASVPWRLLIEKILTHVGLDPQPPPKGRADEPRPHFAD